MGRHSSSPVIFNCGLAHIFHCGAERCFRPRVHALTPFVLYSSQTSPGQVPPHLSAWARGSSHGPKGAPPLISLCKPSQFNCPGMECWCSARCSYGQEPSAMRSPGEGAIPVLYPLHDSGGPLRSGSGETYFHEDLLLFCPLLSHHWACGNCCTLPAPAKPPAFVPMTFVLCCKARARARVQWVPSKATPSPMVHQGVGWPDGLFCLWCPFASLCVNH